MARTAHPPLASTVARQQMQNASFTGPAGQMGLGDRGSFSYIPQYTGNPYDSNDFVFRWRQYVHLYETSWEARKIVRIVPEDALRKDWIAEDIPEEMATGINAHLDRIQFSTVLKRSLMLERLLGGCLTFMGLDGDKDDPSKPFHPRTGATLRFCNAIPISRIARMSWDTNPLSEHYMRPNLYTINGEELHVSRCLVWDGEPLFDPYDFALTNFRGNLAGFGPSKLAPIWDDIVKAVGTRQAAYQLIQTNNAILVAVQDLQDLAGTKSGREALAKVKSIAQQLSAYNAALIDGDKVDVKQHSASFGSVPELIMTFIQILSAASDIPATRFLGQAPGGLNATGESDLENYYNVIDAYQRQRIEPQLRRVYDIIGYSKYRQQWQKAREKLTFKFPPLWNLSELEEADRASKNIDNVMRLFEAGFIGEEKAIQEINAKDVLSVNLDDTDIDVARTALGPEDQAFDHETPNASATPPNPAQEIQRLRNQVYVRNADKLGLLVKAVGCDPTQFDMEQIKAGYEVEQEHRDVTHGDPVSVMKIVMAHLTEVPDYYTKLEKVENQAIQNYVEQRDGKWVVLSHDRSKTLGTYDTKAEAEKRLRQIEYFKYQNQAFVIPENVWYRLVKDAQEKSRINFDLENDARVEDIRLEEVFIKEKQKQFVCELRSAGGDWEESVLYFRCQELRSNDKKTFGCFIFIPDGKQGNATLWKDEKGWHASDDDKHRTDAKNNKSLAWDSLKKYLSMNAPSFKNQIELDSLPEPSVDQIAAGNYKKHHLKLHGLDISIENPKGSTRRGVAPNGTSWEAVLPAHYGYVKRTEGADGDYVDLYIGPHEDSELVFVVDQNNLEGEFDEHKCIFGALSTTQAKALYLDGFSDGSGSRRLRAITPMHVDQFKQWLSTGDTKKPYSK